MPRNVDKYGRPKQTTGRNESAQENYSIIADSLKNIFGEVMERDALFAIIESCDGDQSLAADAILKIIGQNQQAVSDHEQPQCSTSQATSSNYQQPDIMNPPNQQQSLSYCNATKAPGSSYSQKTSLTKKDKAPSPIWPEDLKRILYYHNEGYRTLIMLRGLPGSGKSYLAQQIMDMTIGPGTNVYNSHVFSTDDFFYVNGCYVHNKEKLSEAHLWNQERVRSHLLQGRSPVIVDNTNVKFWEMGCYARFGVQEGYYIEILEPSTPWAWKVKNLFRNNKHNVPYQTIKRMSEMFDPSISGQEYIRRLNLQYPSGKEPPMLRCIPKVQKSASLNQIPVVIDHDNAPADQPQQIANVPSLQSDFMTVNEAKDDSGSSESNEGINLEKYAVIAKKIEEFDLIDNEWEKGENWHDGSSQGCQSASTKSPQRGPKPQRNKDKEQLFPTANQWQDWTLLIPPWQQNIPAASKIEPPSPAETSSCSTCIEFGDTDHFNSKYKVVIGTPRNINLYYMPPMTENHNGKMFDKSTITTDDLLSSVEVNSEEKHFQLFGDMFKAIPKNDLRDIFDKCGGNINWAVEMVLYGVPSSKDDGDNVASDVETSHQEESEVHIAPNSVNASVTANENVEEGPKDTKQAVSQLTTPKRGKKDKIISQSSLNLKRVIEKNIVMPDKFYSDHTIRLRKGIIPGRQSNPEGEGTSKDVHGNDTSSEKDLSDNESAINDADENVTFNLGREFVQNLDRLFDRGEDNWDESNVVPLVTMPMSILNQINALWLESLAHQVESQASYSKLMLKQDEEYARQLAEKEEELSRTGQEPAVPDLKEIMDMDLAFSLYQKESAQLKNKAPDFWAARMSMDKLANLFSGIPDSTLYEMLEENNNSFYTSVVTLLMLTGQNHVLEQENGVNKFIMEGEMRRQARVIEAEKKKQLESAEWPVLPSSDNVDMNTVKSYRNNASAHMTYRNENYNKAQDCIRRGMTQYAGYFSNIASFHKCLFEQANNMAATALVQLNQKNNADKDCLDLHFLYVPEALQALDMFIDEHIQALQTQTGRPKARELYIITGRGLHSINGPRIKPACQKRLKKRGFNVQQLNAGLVTIKVTKDCLMTHQLRDNN